MSQPPSAALPTEPGVELTTEEHALVERQLDIAARARALVTAPVPYFAHVELETAGRTTDVLLGPSTAIGRGISIVDWQAAPLAEVFFSSRDGEHYELETGGRVLTGQVRRRCLVTFSSGELTRVVTDDAQLVRGSGGAFTRHPRPALEFVPRHLDGPRQTLEVRLDPAQQQVVDLPTGRTVLVLGEAGHGKTTVALHRLARLHTDRQGNARSAVIVPTEGLRRLTELLLARRGLEDVEVWLYDAWAAAMAQRAFKGLPRRPGTDATAGTIALKRHPALRRELAEIARAPRRTGRADLLHLFGDRERMESLRAHAVPPLTQRAVRDVLEHTHVQFSARAEQEYAHVNAEYLATIDGLSIDEGTPMGDAGTMDTEDHAVLFEIERLRAALGSRPAAGPRRYDCLVVDEAQELAPLELALVGRALAPGGTLVVAGDAAQQTDPTAYFQGWPEAMRELGAQSYEAASLEVSYRCPPEVTALARRVLDPADPRGGVTASAALSLTRFDNECHLVSALVDELANVRAACPTATVAVICRTGEAARRLATLLARGVDVHFVRAGDFDLEGRINVAGVAEVKGLEFDYVVVPDASAAAYPDTPEARRALYVATTRATLQLLLASVGTPSPLYAARRAES